MFPHQGPLIAYFNFSTEVLYGFPAFCSYTALHDCANTTLKNCGECSMTGAGVFGCTVTLLGLAILVANSVVIYLFAKGRSMFTGTYGKIKASLACADLLTGILLLVVVLPNFGRTLNSTAEQVRISSFALLGTPGASIGGVFHLFNYTSSLYHLVLLSQQRLYAVRWPLRYRTQNSNCVYAGIALVWLLALLTSIAPLWFPSTFAFGYQHVVFLYNINLSDMSRDANVTPLIVMIVIVYVVPFVLMSLLTVLTGVSIRKSIEKSAKYLRKDTRRKQRKKAREKNEVLIFTTMATMQMGFTSSIIPLLVITVLSYCGVFTESTISTPYFVLFYLSTSNSLVNVLVYSAVDVKFRTAVKDISKRFIRRKKYSVQGGSNYKKRSTLTAHNGTFKRTYKATVPPTKDSGTNLSHQVHTV